MNKKSTSVETLNCLPNKDADLLRLHMAFDEIAQVLTDGCYHTDSIVKSLDLMKSARHFVLVNFLQNWAGHDAR